MSKTARLTCKILVLLSLWPSLAFSRPGADNRDSRPFLAPRDRAALHLTGLIPLTSAKRAKLWLNECPSDTAFLQKRKFCEHYLEIKRAKVSSTQRKFWRPETQLLIFGERHTENENRAFLIQRLEMLGQNGFNTLALEMFNSDAQKQLDQYLAGELSEKTLRDLFQEHWNYPPESYLKLIHLAKSLGMKLLALDNRSLEQGEFSKDLIRRDKHMAKRISMHLKTNPGDKIAALTGRLHAYKSLSKNQTPATIIEIVQRDYPELEAQSFLMISSREKTAFTVLMKDLIQGHSMKAISSKSFLPYTDGLIHLESLSGVDQF